MPRADIGENFISTPRGKRQNDPLTVDVPKGFTEIRVNFKVKADVDNLERLKRLTAFSPVFNTITQGAKVAIQVKRK